MELSVSRKIQGAPSDRFFRSQGEKVLRRVKGPAFARTAEVSLVLCGDAVIRRLNRDYRRIDRPTDVLSFPQLEGERTPQPKGAPLALGDVVISLPTARRQAQAAGKLLRDEIELLWTHGLLHLLGYDHAEKRDEKRMFALQDRLISRKGRNA